MADLYAEGSLEIIFEAGKKAANGAIAGNVDVHVRDAAIEALQQAHVLLSGHEDEATEQTMAMASPDCSVEDCGKYLQKAIEDAESACPKEGATATAVALDPAQLALLKLIAGYAWKILREYFNK